MTKRTFDIFALALSLVIVGACLIIPAQWSVALIWAAIAVYFYAETMQKGK